MMERAWLVEGAGLEALDQCVGAQHLHVRRGCGRNRAAERDPWVGQRRSIRMLRSSVAG